MPLKGRHDLVVRGGTIYDGTGSKPFVGDVAIDRGRISQVGDVHQKGEEEIDARGRIVTPGFVDIHTHYDGHAVWSDTLAPSSYHGVTTAVMGNCGVGFAPCRPGDREALIDLMEGVEDIPAPVMHEGLEWTWESFAEYLDVLESRTRDMDVCALVPHAPVRVYVMGSRALNLEPATPADVAQMRQIVGEGIRAGAFGVSTSRTTSHQSVNGDYTPTLQARENEISGLLAGLEDAGCGFFEVVTEMGDPDVQTEYVMMQRALARAGVPGVFSLVQNEKRPELWKELLAFADRSIEQGVSFRPVVAPRSIGMLFGLEGSQHPFAGTRTYEGIRNLPLKQRVDLLRQRRIRERILQEDPMEFSSFPFLARIPYSNMFRLGNPPNYTPKEDESVQAIADHEGRPPKSVAYDLLLENEGMGFIYVPFTNYFGPRASELPAVEEMLSNPNTIMGLGDGGAHAGFILDAGFPTFLLTYWVKKRKKFPMEEGIRRLTSDTADAAGLTDRGRLIEGLKADINVIDVDRLDFEAPFIATDLPAGGRRLMQRASGYDATIVSGETTYRNGDFTGARPGRLVRSYEM